MGKIECTLMFHLLIFDFLGLLTLTPPTFKGGEGGVFLFLSFWLVKYR